VKPDWVDVASGVESAPSEKSAALIDAFARAARGALDVHTTAIP
jgi:phosphoribosylanthranilate isomerase